MAGQGLNFYPSDNYLRRNWAPETVNLDDVRALARASRVAAESGILSTRLAKSFAANAMVENTPSFGVVDSTYGYPPNPRRDQKFQRLGLQVERTPNGYRLPGNADAMQRALMSAAVLAEKSRLYGEDKAIERYNGRGRAIEDNGYFGEQRADARHHASKVAEALRMLSHPSNAPLMDAYRQAGGY